MWNPLSDLMTTRVFDDVQVVGLLSNMLYIFGVIVRLHKKYILYIESCESLYINFIKQCWFYKKLMKFGNENAHT